MQLDGTFPGRDLDEILNNMEGVEGLNGKVDYIQENFSMGEMKKLEDEGSELAEEAMIQTARENASEDQVDEFINSGYNENWQENPQQGLAAIEKAIERHPETPEKLEGIKRHEQKVEIFSNLLKDGHVRTADRFQDLVGGVEVPSWDREDSEESLKADQIAKGVYDNMDADRYSEGPEYLDNIVKIAETFDINGFNVMARKQDVVEEYADQDEYRKALRRADMFDIQEVEEDRNVQDIADEGYDNRMGDEKYLEAAEIAQKARRVSNNEIINNNYLEKEREAAKEAFKQNIDGGDYRQAKRAVNRFETEGSEEELQTYLIKKLTNEEIDQEQYQELTEEIGYEPQQEKISEEPEPEPASEPAQNYEQRTAVEEESEGYISKLNPFS